LECRAIGKLGAIRAPAVLPETTKRKENDTSMTRGTGARGLRAAMEQVMMDAMFETTPGSSITVTKAMVSDACGGECRAA
jgi:ATP-dependent protease Clp ATPase subunit